MVWGLPLFHSRSLLHLVQMTSLLLLPVPVTTLCAVNRRGDGQRGIKQRRESSSNWLHVGYVIFKSVCLCLLFLYLLYLPSFLQPSFTFMLIFYKSFRHCVSILCLFSFPVFAASVSLEFCPYTFSCLSLSESAFLCLLTPVFSFPRPSLPPLHSSCPALVSLLLPCSPYCCHNMSSAVLRCSRYCRFIVVLH